MNILLCKLSILYGNFIMNKNPTFLWGGMHILFMLILFRKYCTFYGGMTTSSISANNIYQFHSLKIAHFMESSTELFLLYVIPEFKKYIYTCCTMLVPLEVTLLVVARFPLPATPLPSMECVVKMAGGE